MKFLGLLIVFFTLALSTARTQDVFVPTRACSDSSNAAASTAYVHNCGGGGGGAVSSVFGRTGTVTSQTGDYTFSQIGGVATGAQLPFPSAATLGGVESASAPANQFMNGINTSGVPTFAQPNFTNLLGNIAVGQMNSGTGATSSTVWFGDGTWRTPAGGGNVSTSGTIISGRCAQWNATTTVVSTGTACGSVTSVAVTVPTGLAVSGSPITTSGTLGLTWSGAIPNAQIPAPTASALGGVESITCGGGQFLNAISNSGVPGCSTPAGGGNVSTSGTITSGNCAQWNSTTTLVSTGVPCGSGGGGTSLGFVSIKDRGATGDGTCHPLSGTYASLAAAQAVYPFVSDLTQCIDWAASQQAINVAYAIGPSATDSAPIFCPGGDYQLSLPLFVDQANNSQGTAAAWASGTTYNNGDIVKYNGIQWQSQGSGNVGNPPTAVNGQPGTIRVQNINGFPLTTAAISNGSPAVITYTNPGFVGVVANEGVIFSTQQYPVQPGSVTPALPTGLNVNQVYYVVGSSITTSQFSVSATPGGAAINTSSAGAGIFFVTGQTWQVSPAVGAGFSNRVSFIGEEGVPSNTGCRFNNLMANTPTVYLGPQNGGLIKSINLHSFWHGLGGYRCSQLSNMHGFVGLVNGGGTSRFKFENVSADGFYADYLMGLGSGTGGDSNSWEKSEGQDACKGIWFLSTQSFINSAYDSNFGYNTTGIQANITDGFKVVGGNYSNTTTQNTSFAISGVTTGGSGCGFSAVGCVSMTVASPDSFLTFPGCSMNAGAALAQSPRWLNSWPDGSACTYNVFTILTAHHGVQAFYPVHFNPFTNLLVVAMAPGSTGIWQSNCCTDLAADIAAATTIYASEAITPFFGNIQAESFHLENTGATTLECVCTAGFALGLRPGMIKDVNLDWPVSAGDAVCCNASPSAAQLAIFYAQQSIPFLNAHAGSMIVDALANGQNSFGSRDRLLVAVSTDSYFENRHSDAGLFLNAAPQFDLIEDNISFPAPFGGSNGQLSGEYFAFGAGAAGGGKWDNASSFVSGATQLNYFSNTQMPDQWRVAGWGQTPMWGIRPAPWSSPCVIPSQVTTLQGALPAITHSSQLAERPNSGQFAVTVVSGGTGYIVGDVLNLSGGTFSVQAQVRVTSVSSGVITGVALQTAGTYSVEIPTGTISSTGGTGTGATFGNPNWSVFYTIGYPTLWGGQTYRICGYSGGGSVGGGPALNTGTGGKYSIMSQNAGYSYFQNLTTTNVPNLLWTMRGTSPFIYMNQELLELMFPGLVIGLVSDGTGGCTAVAQQNFMVLETHPTLGYVKVVRVDSDGSNYLPTLAGTGVQCKNNTIAQQGVNPVYPY